MVYNELMRNYHVPRYDELPDFPIFVDQVISFIESKLTDYFFDDEKIITKSMINNYVKQGIVRPPVKKKYERDQLVFLIIICILKKSFTLEEIAMIINSVLESVDIVVSYNYYCDELENCVKSIIEKREIVHIPYHQVSDGFIYACQSVIMAVAHKIYLEVLVKTDSKD